MIGSALLVAALVVLTLLAAGGILTAYWVLSYLREADETRLQLARRMRDTTGPPDGS